MIQAAILAPLALAAVLGVSAMAKLRDPASLDAAFTQLKVPAALDRGWLKRSVPWFELALAVALLVAPWPVGALAAAGSLALFAVYTVLIARAWRAPEEADCHCFGALAPGRVTGWTVGRNVLLVAGSLVAVADAVVAGPVLPRLLDPGVLAWLVGAGAVSLLVFTIVHQPAPDAVAQPAGATASGTTASGTPLDDDGEYVRLPIPFSRLVTPAGDRLTLRQLAAQKPQLLVWVSTGCGSCQGVIDHLEEWQRAVPEVDVRPVVVQRGTLDDRTPTLVDQILVDDEQTLSVFGWLGTPTAVLLGADGLLAGGPVTGEAAITGFVDDVVAQLDEARQAFLEDRPEPAA